MKCVKAVNLNKLDFVFETTYVSPHQFNIYEVIPSHEDGHYILRTFGKTKYFNFIFNNTVMEQT